MLFDNFHQWKFLWEYLCIFVTFVMILDNGAIRYEVGLINFKFQNILLECGQFLQVGCGIFKDWGQDILTFCVCLIWLIICIIWLIWFVVVIKYIYQVVLYVLSLSRLRFLAIQLELGILIIFEIVPLLIKYPKILLVW